MLRDNWEQVFKPEDMKLWETLKFFILDDPTPDQIGQGLYLLHKYFRTKKGYNLNPNRSLRQRLRILDVTMDELKKEIIMGETEEEANEWTSRQLMEHEVEEDKEWERRQKQDESLETRLQREQDQYEASMNISIRQAQTPNPNAGKDAVNDFISYTKEFGNQDFDNYAQQIKNKNKLVVHDDEADLLERLDQTSSPNERLRLQEQINAINHVKSSFISIREADAVSDTINYWDKAKNKDFSKYWRKIKKNKKKKGRKKKSSMFLRKKAMSGDFKWSCLMIELPDDISKKIIAWGKENISDDALYTDDANFYYGREKDIHTTVCFGIDPKVTLANVKDKIDLPKIELKLGKVSKFDTSDDYDVIKIDVESEDLKSLNKKIRKEIGDPGNTYPEYKPHVTIAYVKKGKADDAVGSDEFTDVSHALDTYDYTQPKGHDKYTISSSVPNPIRNNYDYSGELGGPNWIERVKNFMKKREDRKSKFEAIHVKKS